MADLLNLPELTDGSPAGPNLELDAAFGEMERAAQGKPETQYGNTIEPAVPPDWKETASLANSLLERTRDLRVMVSLAVARLHLSGLPAYAEVVAMIRQHLDTMWEHIHPQLDPEDDNDPMQRANALLLLQDPIRVLRPMRLLPLAATPKTGPVSWRDIAVMNGTLEPEGGREKLSEAFVRAAFTETNPERLAAFIQAADSLVGDLRAIPKAFDTFASVGSGPDLKDITKLALDIQKELTKYGSLASEGSPAEEDPAEDVLDANDTERPARTSARGVATIQSITSISSREDALRALELAAEYFRNAEPSSPLPLLIERALRLAPLPFLEILRNLAPDGLMQAQTVVGSPDE